MPSAILARWYVIRVDVVAAEEVEPVHGFGEVCLCGLGECGWKEALLTEESGLTLGMIELGGNGMR